MTCSDADACAGRRAGHASRCRQWQKSTKGVRAIPSASGRAKKRWGSAATVGCRIFGVTPPLTYGYWKHALLHRRHRDDAAIRMCLRFHLVGGRANRTSRPPSGTLVMFPPAADGARPRSVGKARPAVAFLDHAGADAPLPLTKRAQADVSLRPSATLERPFLRAGAPIDVGSRHADAALWPHAHRLGTARDSH